MSTKLFCSGTTISGKRCKRRVKLEGRCVQHKEFFYEENITKEENVPVLEFPLEILDNIFSFVSHRERIFVSEVCKKFLHASRIPLLKEQEKLYTRLRQIASEEISENRGPISRVALGMFCSARRKSFYKDVEEGTCDKTLLYLVCEMGESELLDSFMKCRVTSRRKAMICNFRYNLFLARKNKIEFTNETKDVVGRLMEKYGEVDVNIFL